MNTSFRPVVTIEAADGALVAVAIRDAAADLERAAVLRGAARRIFEELGPDARKNEVGSFLLREGAASPREAREDASRFVAELAAHDLAAPEHRQGPATEPAVSNPVPSDASTRASWTSDATGAADFLELARAVLAAGHRLRFRAFGRSMRPLVPHGSRLEIERRAFERVRLGEVVLHSTKEAQLVAHRVVGRHDGQLVTRGDSNARRELVDPDSFLGVVIARETDGQWSRLSGGPSRWLGLTLGSVYAALVGLVRLLFLRPLRATFGGRSVLRSALRLVLRVASGSLFFLERLAIRVRRPLDVLRSALLSTEEKDTDRTRLYERRAIQKFTSLDENLRSGLTLLEELLLARHPLPPGKALVLGCGPGRECLVLARRGFDVTGIDREEGMLDKARELADAAGLTVRYRTAEAVDFDIEGGPFDVVVIFSGLYNMVLPRERRVRMLAASRRHLRPGGHVFVTFLSAYLWPGAGPPAGGKHLLEALNPEHERGDFYLLNEAVHVFPRGADVAAEALAAELEPVDLHRDQRAYDRAEGMVRGYAVLRRADAEGGQAPENPGSAGHGSPHEPMEVP